jgi:hypothetical protein
MNFKTPVPGDMAIIINSKYWPELIGVEVHCVKYSTARTVNRVGIVQDPDPGNVMIVEGDGLPPKRGPVGWASYVQDLMKINPGKREAREEERRRSKINALCDVLDR